MQIAQNKYALLWQLRDSSIHCIHFLILGLEFLEFFYCFVVAGFNQDKKPIHQASGLFLFSVTQVKKEIVKELLFYVCMAFKTKISTKHSFCSLKF